MYRRALSDGCVWLAAGLACFALFFALVHWAGASPTIEFIRGFLIGLAIVTFSAATVMLVVQHRKAPQKPVSRATPSQKARR